MASNPFATGGAASSAPASPFGTTNQPATGANGATATDTALNQTQHVPDPVPDIDDPSLTSETLTAREGDAFAAPPPPPDGIYRVKLKLRGVRQEDMPGRDIAKFLAGADVAQWVPENSKDRGGNITGSFAKTIMDVQIVDAKYPELADVYLQVPFKWTDTRTSGKGLSKIMTLLTLAGNAPNGQPWVDIGDKATGRPPKNYGHKQMMEIFIKFLAGEPEILCRSEWSASCDVCGQAAKASGTAYPKSTDGMNRFPQVPGKPGVYSPDLPCLVNRAHGTTKARAMAVQFFALGTVVGK